MATFVNHPDRGGEHEAFIDAQYAWEILNEPTCRSVYIRAYLARHPRQEQEQATGPRQSEQRGASTGSTTPRCTGVQSDGSLCTKPPMTGSERCTMHHSQSDDDIERILRRYTRTFFCKGRNRDGMPCGNLASKGSDRCWVHGGGPRDGRADVPRQGWACQGNNAGRWSSCHSNCLIGADMCWDHATEDQREAAVRRAEPGCCAAVTQRGRPCRARRTPLGGPLCIDHTTRGLLDEITRDAPWASSPSAPPPSAPPPPPSPARDLQEGIVRCPACGKKNRVPRGGSGRCGICRADLPGAPGESSGVRTPPAASRSKEASSQTLEGVGWGRSRSFTIPPTARTWRLSWSCGPNELCPFIRVAKSDGVWDLGTIGGAGLREGFSHFSETGDFFLDCQVSDWWKAEIDVVE